MAGPTPISALIHAATMVAAGIFLVARLYPVSSLAPTTLTVLAVIACITMLGGASRRSPRTTSSGSSPGRRSASSPTCSPALAVGGRRRGVFHLLTHAAFKALLFLARRLGHPRGRHQPDARHGRAAPADAGHVRDDDGRLAALAGVPPLAGVFTKEAVLGAAEETA